MVDNNELQQEISDFIESIKASGSVMHQNPRFVHHNANFGMEFFNEKNYIEMFYSLNDLVPGQDYDWASPTCKITMEFDGDWIDTVVHLPYSEEKLAALHTFCSQNRLMIVAEEKKELTEEQILLGEGQEAPKLIFGKEKIKYFIVNGLALFDIDVIKQFIVTMDNLLHSYQYEVAGSSDSDGYDYEEY